MTNKELVEFCKAAKDKPVMYMWGDYGRPITEATILAKAGQYPKHYDAAYQGELRAQIGKGIGCDCTGLIKWFLWTDGNIDVTPKYNSETDNSASGWYRNAKVRGKIEDIPYDRAGLIVSMSGHCGVYIGDGNVTECTKGKYGNGVVQTRLIDREWEVWCECVYIDYISESTPDNELKFVTAHVSRNTPAYSDLKRKTQIGTVFNIDELSYLGDLGDMAVVIYPSAASYKVAFIDKNNLVL